MQKVGSELMQKLSRLLKTESDPALTKLTSLLPLTLPRTGGSLLLLLLVGGSLLLWGLAADCGRLWSVVGRGSLKLWAEHRPPGFRGLGYGWALQGPSLEGDGEEQENMELGDQVSLNLHISPLGKVGAQAKMSNLWTLLEHHISAIGFVGSGTPVVFKLPGISFCPRVL